jgi:hypothetical protein
MTVAREDLAQVDVAGPTVYGRGVPGEIRACNVRFVLTGPPVRRRSNFVNGLKSIPARVVG